MKKETLEKISYGAASFGGFSAPLFLVRFSIGELRTNLLDLMLFVCAILILSANTASAKKTASKLKFLGIAGFVFLAAVSLSWSLGGFPAKGLGVIKSHLILPIFFAFSVATKKECLFSALKGFFWGNVFLGICSAVAALSGKLTFDHRLAFPFSSANELSLALAPQILLGFFWLKEELAPLWQKIALWASLLLLSLVLALTVSYSAWIALISGFLVTTFFFKERRWFLFSFLAAIIVCASLVFWQIDSPKGKAFWQFSERSSLSSRLMIWQASWKIISDNPLWGTGPASFQQAYLSYQRFFPPYLEWAVPHPHNIFLALLVYGGPLALFSLMAIIASMLSNSLLYKKGCRDKKTAAPSAAILAYSVYFLAVGFLDTPYWRGDLALGFWLLAAASFLLVAKQENYKDIR